MLERVHRHLDLLTRGVVTEDAAGPLGVRPPLPRKRLAAFHDTRGREIRKGSDV